MATWEDLKELRLRICDPSGVIAIIAVADGAAISAVVDPARQTAYLQEDSGEYHIYDPDLEVWEHLDLELSDIRLETLIDLYGIDKAAPKAVKLILSAVGKRLGIARSQSGSESVAYQSISDVYAYYKALYESMEEEFSKDSGTSTGRYLRMHRPRIGGGM